MMISASDVAAAPLPPNPLSRTTIHRNGTVPNTGPLNGRPVHVSADPILDEAAHHIMERSRQIAMDHVVNPLKVAGNVVDKSAREIVWAVKDIPVMGPVLGLVRTVLKIASVVTGWLVSALDRPVAEPQSEEEALRLVDQTTWPTAIRQFLSPITLILKLAKAAMDWTISVLETVKRPDWGMDPADYLDKAVEKYVNVTQSDLKNAARRTLRLSDDCLVSDIANALSELSDDNKQLFHTALFDEFFDRIEATPGADCKKLDDAKEGLRWLGETFNATPAGKRGMFFQSEKNIATKLLGHSGFERGGPEVVASLTIAPTLIWNAVADHSRYEATHL